MFLFQIDAFTDRLFGGNPAAVVPLETWLPDDTMQRIAGENNLSETAFFVPAEQPDHYALRWFTPTVEVDLCGHATLATAFAIFNCLKINRSERLSFHTRSGWLHVERSAGGWLTLDLPTDTLRPAEMPQAAQRAFGTAPEQVLAGREDYLLVYASAAVVRALQPDFGLLKTIPAMRGFIATAPGDEAGCDVVSRCFFPAFGIDEDPVTGSAHTTLTPYWAQRLGKNTLTARQVSARGGLLHCTLQGERTSVSGQCVLYMEGKIFV